MPVAEIDRGVVGMRYRSSHEHGRITLHHPPVSFSSITIPFEQFLVLLGSESIRVLSANVALLRGVTNTLKTLCDIERAMHRKCTLTREIWPIR